jgi:hypothetical protein
MADQKHLIGYTNGYTRTGKESIMPVIVEVSYTNGQLSLTGNVGNDSFGQISKPEFVSFAAGWNQEDADQLWAYWDRWHLNGMRSGCIHQRAEYDIHKKITLHKYGWTRAFHKMRRMAERGEMDAEAYAEYKEQAALVRRVTLGPNSPKYPQHPEIQDALKRGLIEKQGTEEKIANWVDYREHPEGVLSKPCRVCGYAYGTQWLFEEVPAEVIQWLNAKVKDAESYS